MTLEKRIEALRKDVSSDRLSMSIGELAGLYEREELDIHPKFQRILRWSDEQKTKLIESVLLRIPIPPIFVAQDSEGHWDVVDGVQRLGTLFQFMGILKDPQGNSRPRLMLASTVLLPELGGTYFDHENAQAKTFSPAQRLDFRRSRLDLHIILKESDPSAKYELFERLNTGGSIASAQEVRNCVLVWINESRFDWLEKLTEDETFRRCVPLSDRLEEQEYRTELALRFLVFYSIDLAEFKEMRDVGEFLNERNRAIAFNKKFDEAREAQVFQQTFRLINEAVGPDAFRKYDPRQETFQGAFLISAFEAVAFGVARNLDAWINAGDAAPRMLSRVKHMWGEPRFTEHIGTGVAARPRMQRTIPFGREYFIP